jgi:hypothetical protein
VSDNGKIKLDAAELDAGLIELEVSQPHFVGGDMDAVQAHFGKDMGELNTSQMATAVAYVYLRRAQLQGRYDGEASWEVAADRVAVVNSREGSPPTPFDAATLKTLPPSATTGE